MNKMGPNVRLLIATRMATIAVPRNGGLGEALNFLRSKELIIAGAKEAAIFTKKAIELVRQACDPNPWRKASDEKIAGELLDRIEKRKNRVP